jgi:hypothetical protein
MKALLRLFALSRLDRDALFKVGRLALPGNSAPMRGSRP